VKLTGPDGVNPWPRGPNQTGGYPLDGRMATLQEQALGALVNHSAATLEDVVDHYNEFFKRVRVTAVLTPVPPVASTDGLHFDRQPTPEERPRCWRICENCRRRPA
jgi:hypothetical protein